MLVPIPMEGIILPIRQYGRRIVTNTIRILKKRFGKPMDTTDVSVMNCVRITVVTAAIRPLSKPLNQVCRSMKPAYLSAMIWKMA